MRDPSNVGESNEVRDIGDNIVSGGKDGDSSTLAINVRDMPSIRGDWIIFYRCSENFNFLPLFIALSNK